MITLTPKAVTYLEELSQKEYPNMIPNLRISVLGAGCSGMSYKLGWETELKAGEICFPFEKFQIVIDKRSMLFIEGLELDYSDGLNGTGFIFNNPLAKRVCGCGSSFST